MTTVHISSLPSPRRRGLRSVLLAVAMAACSVSTPTFADEPRAGIQGQNHPCSGQAGLLADIKGEREALEKELKALQDLIKRAQAALDESIDDTDIIDDVVNLFSDEPPNQGLVELIKVVETEIRNRLTRLKVLQEQTKQALEELQRCQDRLAYKQTRFGQSETRLGAGVGARPPPDLRSLASSQDESSDSVGPGSGIGLGDGGTP